MAPKREVEEEYRRYKEEISKLSREQLDARRPNKILTSSALQKELEKTVKLLLDPKIKVDPGLLHVQVKKLLYEQRWRELEAKPEPKAEPSSGWVNQACQNQLQQLASRGDGAAAAGQLLLQQGPQARSAFRQLPPGKSPGVRQLAAVQAAKPAACAPPGGLGAPAPQWECCLCKKPCAEGQDACEECQSQQQAALDGANQRREQQSGRQAGSRRVLPASLKQQPLGAKDSAPGALPPPNGKTQPSRLPALNFYQPVPGSAAAGGSGQAGVAGRPRRGAAEPQPEQQGKQQQLRSQGAKGRESDPDEDFEPPPRAGTLRGRAGQRRSVPPTVEEQAPIDLVDSSDEEAAAAAAGTARERGQGGQGDANAAGPGPSSTAAAAAAAGSTRATRAARRSRGSVVMHDFRTLALQLSGLKCCYPPEGGKQCVEVNGEDLARLEKGEFLNDTCIDVYTKFLEHQLPEELRARYHIFNTFFLKKLMEKQQGKQAKAEERNRQNHERVKKWTKGFDLFSKDYIFVPVHDALHWSLVLICHPANVVQDKAYAPPKGAGLAAGAEGLKGPAGAGMPVMLHLDSLEGSHGSQPVFQALRSYLRHEWVKLMADETLDSVPRRWAERFRSAGQEPPAVPLDTPQGLPGVRLTSRLPKQTNSHDCGLFLLTYMEFFIAGNPACIVIQDSNAKDVHAVEPKPEAANPNTFLKKDWFQPSNAGRLRDHLRAFICGLMLGRLPPEDARRSVAQGVVDEYERKPERLGVRYLSPVKYLSYVTERPNEPEPVNDDDVLSSGSDGEGEGPIENPEDVLQTASPRQRLTRKQAKEIGYTPPEAGPLPDWNRGGNKRRKLANPGSGAAAAPAAGSDPAAAVVDLASPDKTQEGEDEEEDGPQEQQQQQQAESQQQQQQAEPQKQAKTHEEESLVTEDEADEEEEAVAAAAAVTAEDIDTVPATQDAEAQGAGEDQEPVGQEPDEPEAMDVDGGPGGNVEGGPDAEDGGPDAEDGGPDVELMEEDSKPPAPAPLPQPPAPQQPQQPAVHQGGEQGQQHRVAGSGGSGSRSLTHFCGFPLVETARRRTKSAVKATMTQNAGASPPAPVVKPSPQAHEEVVRGREDGAEAAQPGVAAGGRLPPAAGGVAAAHAVMAQGPSQAQEEEDPEELPHGVVASTSAAQRAEGIGAEVCGALQGSEDHVGKRKHKRGPSGGSRYRRNKEGADAPAAADIIVAAAAAQEEVMGAGGSGGHQAGEAGMQVEVLLANGFVPGSADVGGEDGGGDGAIDMHQGEEGEDDFELQQHHQHHHGHHRGNRHHHHHHDDQHHDHPRHHHGHKHSRHERRKQGNPPQHPTTAQDTQSPGAAGVWEQEDGLLGSSGDVEEDPQAQQQAQGLMPPLPPPPLQQQQRPVVRTHKRWFDGDGSPMEAHGSAAAVAPTAPRQRQPSDAVALDVAGDAADEEDNDLDDNVGSWRGVGILESPDLVVGSAAVAHACGSTRSPHSKHQAAPANQPQPAPAFSYYHKNRLNAAANGSSQQFIPPALEQRQQPASQFAPAPQAQALGSKHEAGTATGARPRVAALDLARTSPHGDLAAMADDIRAPAACPAAAAAAGTSHTTTTMAGSAGGGQLLDPSARQYLSGQPPGSAGQQRGGVEHVRLPGLQDGRAGGLRGCGVLKSAAGLLGAPALSMIPQTAPLHAVEPARLVCGQRQQQQPGPEATTTGPAAGLAPAAAPPQSQQRGQPQAGFHGKDLKSTIFRQKTLAAKTGQAQQNLPSACEPQLPPLQPPPLQPPPQQRTLQQHLAPSGLVLPPMTESDDDISLTQRQEGSQHTAGRCREASCDVRGQDLPVERPQEAARKKQRPNPPEELTQPHAALEQQQQQQRVAQGSGGAHGDTVHAPNGAVKKGSFIQEVCNGVAEMCRATEDIVGSLLLPWSSQHKHSPQPGGAQPSAGKQSPAGGAQGAGWGADMRFADGGADALMPYGDEDGDGGMGDELDVDDREEFGGGNGEGEEYYSTLEDAAALGEVPGAAAAGGGLGDAAQAEAGVGDEDEAVAAGAAPAPALVLPLEEAETHAAAEDVAAYNVYTQDAALPEYVDSGSVDLAGDEEEEEEEDAGSGDDSGGGSGQGDGEEQQQLGGVGEGDAGQWQDGAADGRQEEWAEGSKIVVEDGGCLSSGSDSDSDSDEENDNDAGVKFEPSATGRPKRRAAIATNERIRQQTIAVGAALSPGPGGGGAFGQGRGGVGEAGGRGRGGGSAMPGRTKQQRQHEQQQQQTGRQRSHGSHAAAQGAGIAAAGNVQTRVTGAKLSDGRGVATGTPKQQQQQAKRKGSGGSRPSTGAKRRGSGGAKEGDAGAGSTKRGKPQTQTTLTGLVLAGRRSDGAVAAVGAVTEQQQHVEQQQGVDPYDEFEDLTNDDERYQD
ncbi:hypothetical protein Agub_g3204 [Astrephomene gubernaculifera]|uniref:Ubiquitin-like protease family profile domain-containing protein n=1 Tax=Astrephomene gubernaculifera TaxID=47775 RepID=A0AAD3HI90_9CHLO|nr:hypothetical protein Agub_g3204 [Astrephomene gubernaculifera]